MCKSRRSARSSTRTLHSSGGNEQSARPLVSPREDASKPNSAFMRLKGRGFGYFEESNKCEVLNTSRMKEMVNPGEVTASEKCKVQETFEITDHM